MTPWELLNHQIVDCERCGRLRDYCREIARTRRKAFRDETYWGRPLPNFGDPQARLLIVGLAPAAHGANRTGRMFTGDRSGEWLYRALHEARFANQPTSTAAGDGLALTDCAITAACHCAPPDNKPAPDELAACRGFLLDTTDLLPVRVFLALGQIGWRAVVDVARERRWFAGPLPKFAHQAVVPLAGGRHLVGSYHPSQQNTFTGRLTRKMLAEVLDTVRRLLSEEDGDSCSRQFK